MYYLCRSCKFVQCAASAATRARPPHTHATPFRASGLMTNFGVALVEIPIVAGKLDEAVKIFDEHPHV